MSPTETAVPDFVPYLAFVRTFTVSDYRPYLQCTPDRGMNNVSGIHSRHGMASASAPFPPREKRASGVASKHVLLSCSKVQHNVQPACKLFAEHQQRCMLVLRQLIRFVSTRLDSQHQQFYPHRNCCRTHVPPKNLGNFFSWRSSSGRTSRRPSGAFSAPTGTLPSGRIRTNPAP